MLILDNFAKPWIFIFLFICTFGQDNSSNATQRQTLIFVNASCLTVSNDYSCVNPSLDALLNTVYMTVYCQEAKGNLSVTGRK